MNYEFRGEGWGTVKWKELSESDIKNKTVSTVRLTDESIEIIFSDGSRSISSTYTFVTGTTLESIYYPPIEV